MSGTVTFAAGQTTQTVTVATRSQFNDENDETVTVTLSNPSGTQTPVLGDSVATGTIVDNDSATIAINDTSVTEGGNLVFTLTRSTTSDDPQSVDYTVATGTARGVRHHRRLERHRHLCGRPDHPDHHRRHRWRFN